MTLEGLAYTTVGAGVASCRCPGVVLVRCAGGTKYHVARACRGSPDGLVGVNPRIHGVQGWTPRPYQGEVGARLQHAICRAGDWIVLDWIAKWVGWSEKKEENESE